MHLSHVVKESSTGWFSNIQHGKYLACCGQQLICLQWHHPAILDFFFFFYCKRPFLLILGCRINSLLGHPQPILHSQCCLLDRQGSVFSQETHRLLLCECPSVRAWVRPLQVKAPAPLACSFFQELLVQLLEGTNCLKTWLRLALDLLLNLKQIVNHFEGQEEHQPEVLDFE